MSCDERIYLYCSEEEANWIEAIADEHNVSRSSIVRALIIDKMSRNLEKGWNPKPVLARAERDSK